MVSCRMPSRASPSLISAAEMRCAVVAHRGARQSALLHRLRQAVCDVLRRFGQIPLQMAGKPRAIIEHAEQDRCVPFAARRQHLARAVMTIPVPGAAHIFGLVAAHLARLEPRRGASARQRSVAAVSDAAAWSGRAPRGSAGCSSRTAPGQRAAVSRPGRAGCRDAAGTDQLLWAPYCVRRAWRSARVIDACCMPASAPPCVAARRPGHAARCGPATVQRSRVETRSGPVRRCLGGAMSRAASCLKAARSAPFAGGAASSARSPRSAAAPSARVPRRVSMCSCPSGSLSASMGTP